MSQELELKEDMILYGPFEDNRIEIIAIRKGYVMYRLKGRQPYASSVKEFKRIFLKNYKPICNEKDKNLV